MQVVGLLFPGAGHILAHRVDRGIMIAITFVILSYISGIILTTILNMVQPPPEFYPLTALGFVPTFAVWLLQIFDLNKIVGPIPKISNPLQPTGQ